MYSEIGWLGIQWGHIEVWEHMMFMMGALIVPYMVGMINPAIKIAEKKGIDITKEGSGNPGTTNTFRVLGPGAAVIVLLVDVLKGFLMVLAFGKLMGIVPAMTAAFGVFLGHVYPISRGFNGGKGVATAFGALTALQPQIGLGCLAVVLVAVLITRRVSFGSIFGAIACPVLTYFYLRRFLPISLVMALIVILRHKDNIVRLRRGEEAKISFRAKGKGPRRMDHDEFRMKMKGAYKRVRSPRHLKGKK